MRTTIEIDEALLAEAVQRSGLKTCDEVMALALSRYVNYKRQKDALDVLQGLGWEGDLDAMRTDKRRPEWG